MKTAAVPALILGILALASPAFGQTLTIAAGPNNPGSGSPVSPGTANVPMLQFSLTASTTYSVTVYSVIAHAQGTLNDATGISAVKLWVDANNNGALDVGTDIQLGGSGTYSADNGTVSFAGFSRAIAVGSPQYWLITCDVSAAAAGGATFQAGFTQASDFNAQYKPS